MPTSVAFLGPAGTFSEDALRAATAGLEIEARPAATVYEAIRAVGEGDVDRALVPFENSIEGSVRSTLDTLAFEGFPVTIAGEHDHPIRTSLIARVELSLADIQVVLSHPQASAQCARFIRETLPDARVRAAPSTAEAIREVSASPEPWAALGAASAARIYDCVVLQEGVEDSSDNVTRFVWIAPTGTKVAGGGSWRTTLVFSELGADHPGALVEALTEFSSREVNLTRIESRPRRRGLGRYMFFLDLDGAAEDPTVADAIEALRGKAESVRILGTYPIAAKGIPGT
ncbi:MAG: prephenate dehydratase [Solirubrobacterales bacterium]